MATAKFVESGSVVATAEQVTIDAAITNLGLVMLALRIAQSQTEQLTAERDRAQTLARNVFSARDEQRKRLDRAQSLLDDMLPPEERMRSVADRITRSERVCVESIVSIKIQVGRLAGDIGEESFNLKKIVDETLAHMRRQDQLIASLGEQIDQLLEARNAEVSP